MTRIAFLFPTRDQIASDIIANIAVDQAGRVTGFYDAADAVLARLRNAAAQSSGSGADETTPPFSTARHRKEPSMNDQTTTHKPVLVRTYSAGVHFGYLVNREGKEVTLERSRRIWRWYGAWTLSEIAAKGLDARSSKVAEPVSVVLTEAIEIIDCTPESVASIESAKWAA